MGKYGQAILTVVGTIVGAYFGYPALGAALGSLVGGLLFPQQLPALQGPRLSDVTQTTSSVGTSIPRGWGTFPAAGCIIAKSDIREVIVSDEVGGKGGATQTVETPTYYQDFAVGLSDGEDPILGLDPIAGIRRIWANGKIIYDRRPRQLDEGLGAFNKRIASSDLLESQMTIYLGTEDQLPDPTLEAFYGVGNISAFRGLAYIVFINWQNKPEDGNRMPSSWRFEVYTSGAIDSSLVYEFANEVLYEWATKRSPGVIDPRNSCNEHEYSANSGDPFPVWRSSLGVARADAEASIGRNLLPVNEVVMWSVYPHGMVWPHVPCVIDGDALLLYARFNSEGTIQTGGAGGFHGLEPPDGSAPNVWFLPCATALNLSNGAFGFTFWWQGRQQNFPDPCDNTSDQDGCYQTHQNCGGLYTPPIPPGAVVHSFCTWTSTCMGDDPVVSVVRDTKIAIRRVIRAPDDPCFPCGPNPPAYGADGSYCIINGQIVKAGAWTLDSSQNYNVLQKTATGGVSFARYDKYPLSPALPVGHEADTQSFWEYWYAVAVARRLMDEGLIYGIDYPELQAYGYRREVTQVTIETDPISIAEPVYDLCREAGMQDSEIDVDDLFSTEILGYVRPRVMVARAAIEPLRMTGWFDGIESERTVKFVKRGKPVVLTLSDDELGTAIIGTDKPSKITTRKIQNFDLPRQVRVHYLSYTRDYENGEQSSPVRTDTDAVQEQDVELAVVLTDDNAAQIAEVLWADAWASRWVHEITIDSRYQRLQPADAIAVPVDGRVERMRIINITDVLPNDRKLEMVRDDDGNYVSYAVASVPPVVPPPMTVFGPAELILLDLPMLRDEDDDAGLYAAMRGYLEDNFTGGQIQRSTDGGGNYVKIGQTANEATIGILVQAAPEGPTSIWDEGNEIFIELQSGELENRTEAAVLEGANAAAIGLDGRWEIIQFRTVTNIAGPIYKLTGLLRGRRGTEHFVGTSAVDDRFVLISGAGIVRLPMPLTGVNREYQYKGVATGTTIDAADVINFTGRGVALKPFSPTKVEGSRDASTLDWTVTWIRRGRIGETLQSGTDVPLSEEVEDYEVDVLNLEDTVVRTISVSTPSATYTADQQIIDFGSVQVGLTVVVYQKSAAVGRGTGTEAIL